MNFIMKHKNFITGLIIILAILLISFFCGVNDNKINEGLPPENIETENIGITDDYVEEVSEEIIAEETPVTEPITENEHAEPENEPVVETFSEEEKLVCTISVNCVSAVGKSESMADVIPDDGILLSPCKVNFNSGDSVFDVLKREMINHKIHLEFSITPIYNSAYIEGIGNLYEFDCGAESGWVYKVNGNAPNYSSSMYKVNPGDIIEWIYTCG